MIIGQELLSILENANVLAGTDLHIFPSKSLLHLSVHLADFVAGVPKGLMLYGLVRKPNHHSEFDFYFWNGRLGP